MSDLYKEALIDAKKVREVAEIDAKNRILEQITPYVRDYLSKEISSKTSTRSYGLKTEQQQQPGGVQPNAVDISTGDVTQNSNEDDMSSLFDEIDDAEATQQPAPQPGETTPDSTVQPAEEDSGVLANQNLDAPIKPAGADLSKVSVPDPDGKIVVDFDDLFSSSTPANDNDAMANAAPMEQPQPEGEEAVQHAQPEGAQQPTNNDNMNLEHFKREVLVLSDKIDSVFFSNKPVSKLTENYLKTSMFKLVENIDSMIDRNIITREQAKYNEKKLDFLFLKLNEAISNNSYNNSLIEEKKNNMTTLKEFAATLWEEDEKVGLGKDTLTSGKTGVPVDKDATAHAKDQSGVSPVVGSKEKLEGHMPESDLPKGETPKEEPWEEGEAPLKEGASDSNTDANEDVAKGAAGFGDTDEDPVVEFEIDEKEIMEAIKSIRKENIKRKLSALTEDTTPDDALDPHDGPEEKPEGGKQGDSWENAEPEGGESTALEALDEQLDFGAADDEEDVSVDVVADDADMVDDVVASDDVADSMDAVDGNDADVVLKLDLPDELAELLADLDPADFQVDVDVNAGGMDDEESADIELVDDGSMDVDAEVDVAGDDDEDDEVVLLTDDEDDTEDDMAAETMEENKKLRATLAKARKLIEKRNTEIQELHQHLHETNLFTAKAVFLSKFLMRGDGAALPRKAKRQIVEHLDKAKNLKECKEIYNKIKTKLDEHTMRTSNKLTGSASKATTKSGSDATTSLNESVSKTQLSDADKAFYDRWQILSGLKK